jgi:hypothetical protein
MRHGGGVLFSTVVAITLAGGTAYAGCPNLCDLTVEPAAMEPPLPCAAVNVRADECDCAAGVSLLNTCTTALEALDFSFDACSPEGDLTSVELQCTLQLHSLAGPAASEARETASSLRRVKASGCSAGCS